MAPDDSLLAARALVLRDLAAYRADVARVVSIVEDVLTERRWWVEQWPEGAAYVPGLVAQDVQDAMLERVARWPACPIHHGDPEAEEDGHVLHVLPDLGVDPHWVCERHGTVVAPLGGLVAQDSSDQFGASDPS